MSRKPSQIEKITLSAILLAMAIVLEAVLKFVRIPHLGFISVSLTPTIVIFSSLYMGPFYGMAVGALADLLPAFINPVAPYNFTLTIFYGILGVLPWLLERLTRHFRSFFRKPYLFYFFLLLSLLSISFLFFGSQILDNRVSYFFEGFKYVVLAFSLLLFVALSIFLFFFDQRMKHLNLADDMPRPYEIGFIGSVCEFSLLSFGRALSFYLYFFVTGVSKNPTSYLAILAMQLLASPIDLSLIAFFVPWMMSFASRHNVKR